MVLEVVLEDTTALRCCLFGGGGGRYSEVVAERFNRGLTIGHSLQKDLGETMWSHGGGVPIEGLLVYISWYVRGIICSHCRRRSKKLGLVGGGSKFLKERL